MKRVAVIGGGISGLSAANFLIREDIELTVIEQSNQVGGLMNTVTKEGYHLETGPNSVMLNNPEFLDLLKDLNLIDSIIYPEEVAAKSRFILMGKKPVALPSGPGNLFGNKVIGWSGIATILREPFRKANRYSADESLASFCKRRFSTSLFDNVIAPFVTGVYAGDPEKMSAKFSMKALWEAEKNHGSIIKGMMKSIKERKADPRQQELPKQKMISFKDGLRAIPELIQSKLGDRLQLNSTVTSIEKLKIGYRIHYTQNEQQHQLEVDHIISGLPAYVEAQFWKDTFPQFTKQLNQVYYAPTVAIHLGYDKKQVKNQTPGFGILTRVMEQKSFLGILFINRFFPHNTPKEKDLFAIIIGGARSPELTQLPQEELIEKIKTELAEIMEISGEPELVNYIKWEKGIPQYNLGHEDLVTEEAKFCIDNPNYQIIGNYIHGVSVADSIKKGVLAAQKITA
jgi:oxygen-dependent protoporphyrinogen oxidase